ncbi:MAG: polysaccharide deacetylase family protein [Bacteroidota bacterium]
MYLHKTPGFLQKLYPSLTWRQPGSGKIIYLTFDDGPIPEVTEFVLETLNQYEAKATFFCVGHNVEKHPEIFMQLIEEGNKAGNHTFNHLNGWETDQKTYFRNILKCDEAIEKNTKAKVDLFRPPYGRIPRKLIDRLTNRYNVIMWDNLTADFDKGLSKEKCLEEAVKNTSNGSIIVFHDSLKAFRNLKYVLPRYLDHFRASGYAFKAL